MPVYARYKPDHKSFGEFMLSKQVRDAAKAAAGDVAAIARENSPRSNGPGPHMADKFKVNGRTVQTVGGNPRATAEVYNEDPAAAPNEFGGPRNKAVRMLGRAGAVIGELRGEPG